MSQPVEQRVPDLGDFHDVEVIEVLVKTGDRVQPETPLITLETDKATMDVPATAAGVVQEVKLRKGDRVSKDSLMRSVISAGGLTRFTDGRTRDDSIEFLPRNCVCRVCVRCGVAVSGLRNRYF